MFCTKMNRLLGICGLLLSLWAVCIDSATQPPDNVDRIEPVVRRSPDPNKADQFGFSVALHQIAEPTDFVSAISNTRIMVGAPKGTYPGGVSGLPVSMEAEDETGLVYQCPLQPGTCGPIERTNNESARLFDGEADGTNLDPGPTSTFTTRVAVVGEEKSGQLMGAGLISNGDYFMACAPRWITIGGNPANAIDNRRSIGRCFISGRNLSNFAEVRPCRGATSGSVAADNDQNRCQAGFSAAILNDGTQTSVFLGAPGLGSNTAPSQGSVYVYRNAEQLFDPNNEILLLANNDNPLTPQEEVLSATAYNGFSLTTGNINGQAIVDGAPRYTGQNLLGRVNIRSRTNAIFMDHLFGKQTGEYFGHSVATADLNNDGFDEVIVGAPLWSRTGAADVGRVFIFINNNGMFEPNDTVILEGTKANGRFGHSIVNLGDINGDDVEDIAVGAPYAATNNPNATGMVFIYFGNDRGSISTSPGQTISSDEFLGSATGLTRLTSFGFSLGAQVDVDNNEYKDLVIGAYDSQTAILLRTLSIATINFTLTTNIETVSLDTASKFPVTLCASYSGRGLTGRPLSVEYVLSEVKASSQTNALTLVARTSPDIYQGVLNFLTTGSQICVDTNVTVRTISDLQRTGVELRAPLRMRVTFNQVNRPAPNINGQLSDFRNFPRVQASSANNTVTITPTLDCTLNNGIEVCMPDLSVAVTRVTYRNMDKTFDSIVASAVTTVRFELTVRNLASDAAVNSHLDFDLPDTFPFTSASARGDQVTCNIQPEFNTTRRYRCNLQTYIQGDETVNIVLDWMVDSRRVVGMEPNITARFTVGLPSGDEDRDVDTNPANDMTSTTLLVDAITDPQLELTVNGPTRYETDSPSGDVEAISDLGNTVDITVSVSNAGDSVIPKARLEINVPVNASDGKFYLYVGRLTLTGRFEMGYNVTCKPDGVDPEDINFMSRSRKRRSIVRRQMEMMLPGTVERCPFDNPAPSCQTFTCDITNLGPNNQQFSVLLLAALDRRFYMDRNEIFSFVPYARVVSLNGFEQFDRDLTNNEANEDYTVMPPAIPPPNIFLEIWLPILGGILALIVIISMFICCIYCGFFRKKRVEAAKKALQEQAQQGELEVRQVPPQTVVTEVETKGALDKELEAEIDIGDAADLEDRDAANGSAPPEKEPDETSL